MPTKVKILRACDTLAKRYARGGVDHMATTCPLCLIYLQEIIFHRHKCGNCPNQAFNSGYGYSCVARNESYEKLNWHSSEGEANLSKFWFEVKALLKTKNTKELNNLYNDEELKNRILEIAQSIK